ncbi:chitinase-3-like protein 1 isoform X2 [Toxorhynchites rutilus septentrionalis]|uniref:chitinase-3-like protein 1 isoform X2 n=1 Tax=Toxorhynchites rutilus septentrionalis TaxID=329112 RepID=UPI00247887E1|nr:chitinase-3-like protein 1 isoform X2 [Toxorhynchites rutilus septentrionalis]
MKAVPKYSALSRLLLLLGLLVFSSVVARSIKIYSSEEDYSAGYQPKIVCYISAGNEQYDYNSLRPGLCTHFILIDLIGLNSEGKLLLFQKSSRALKYFLDLRNRFKHVGDPARFILAVGGVGQKSSHFSRALSYDPSRNTAVDNIVAFLTKHRFDGVDIAWFYPGQYGGRKCDKLTLVLFLRALQSRLQTYDASLSLTVGVDPRDLEISYDVAKIDKYIDFVNILTGDYHDPQKPSHISPLLPGDGKDRLNIQNSIKSYIKAGLNPQKTVILLSNYGYLYEQRLCSKTGKFVLKNVQRLTKLGARELIERENFHISWDDSRQVPYATLVDGSGKKWITFNSVESHRRKAEFTLLNQLGGVGSFTLDQDDYEGYASSGSYPMLWAIVDVIRPEARAASYNPAAAYNPIEICPHTGNISHPTCSYCYYECQEGVAISDCPLQFCPDGYIFNEDTNECYRPTAPSSPPQLPSDGFAEETDGTGEADSSSVEQKSTTVPNAEQTPAAEPPE